MKNPVKCKLVGVNDNAFVVMGTWSKAARKAGWSQEEIDEVINEAMSGDYNHLLATIMANSDIEHIF